MSTDHDLLAAWAAGDRRAGSLLVERHYDSIVRFFANKASNDTDDLVQRTFLACAEGAANFRGEGSVRAWLFGIARNLLYTHIRGRMRAGIADPDFRESALVDLAPGASTVAAQRAEQRILYAALQRIPLELQTLLELYYWEDMPVEELAQILDIPAGTVKSRLHRARRLLREACERLPTAPEERPGLSQLLEQWAPPDAEAPSAAR